MRTLFAPTRLLVHTMLAGGQTCQFDGHTGKCASTGNNTTRNKWGGGGVRVTWTSPALCGSAFFFPQLLAACTYRPTFSSKIGLAFPPVLLHSIRRCLDEARPTVMGAQPSAPLSMSDVLVNHVADRRPRTNATQWGQFLQQIPFVDSSVTKRRTDTTFMRDRHE